jgi:hypothetical protein
MSHELQMASESSPLGATHRDVIDAKLMPIVQ